MLPAVRRFGLGSGVASSAYAAYQYNTDDGARRAMQMWYHFGPVALHYRLVEAKQALWPGSAEAAEAEWRALDRRYAAPVVRQLETLQGMYTKYGQIGAGLTNTFSNTWIEELRKLEDQVPPRSPEVVMRTIAEDTGRDVSELFSEFDPTPLGSASIGQVHRARLRSDGTEVAVKVQYPDAGRLFRSDMATIKGFFKLVAPEQLVTLGELERQFEAEFDYRQEADNLVQVGLNMRRHGFAPFEVVVPQPRLELCTRRLLVMELIEGCKLLDGLRRYGAAIALSQGKSPELWEAEERERVEREGMPARYEGPSARVLHLYARWLLVRDALSNSPRWVYNWSLGLLLGHSLGYVHTETPPNAPRMMDVLMRVHGVQLLVDGCFNADTHAGNFLLMPDDRLGLIDYGSVKRLTREERLSACCMYAALGRRDYKTLVELALASGYRSKRNDPEVITKFIRFGNDTFGKELLGEQNAQQFMDSLKADDPYEQVADNLILAGFMSFRLRIVGLALNHPVVCSEWWGQIAERELKRAGVPYESWNPELMREMSSGARIARTYSQ